MKYVSSIHLNTVLNLLFAATTICSAPMICAAAENKPVEFSRDIRPILSAKCLQCHGPDPSTRKAKLRLDLEDHAKNNSVIVAGKPDASELIERISSHDPDTVMPPPKSGKSLTGEEISRLRAWIEQGAKYEANSALSPLHAPPVPAVNESKWPRRDLDRFVLARLESAKLRPAPDADRHIWLRRVYFDLIGLPPSPQEIEAFIADTSADAYRRVVDRLLESPHFGERWGRHWLDLVRYAETYGYESDWPIPLAWRYRDYVIRMFNEDVPYDQIVREHLAGDLLDRPRVHPKDGYNESIIGTGFWYLHGQMSQPVDVLQHEADRFDNQIDTFSRAFIGMTVACARCHDHKFDPITAADYYGLAGFLRSSRMQEAYLDPGGKIASVKKQLLEIRKEADASVPSEAASEPKASDQERPGTVLFESFEGNSFGDWFVHGDAFGEGPAKPEQWVLSDIGIGRIQGGYAHSGMLSGKFRGSLHSRDFTIVHDRVWLRVAGKGTVRITINGYMMQRHRDLLFEGTQIQVNVPSDQFSWVELAGSIKNYRGHRAYLEIEDNSDGQLVIDEIRFADAPPPKEDKPVLTPVSPQDAARFEAYSKRMAEAERDLPAPMQVLAMCDGTPGDEHIRTRGIVRSMGELVPRRMLISISGEDQKRIEPQQGSGRLEFAQRMVAPSNPLTARVRVNWVWHHLFGRGIVASVDNFGAMGDAPSHPMLLDHLADRFRGDMRWSMKQLIREIVLSATYQMSSDASNVAADHVDPTNELLHRYPVRRLQGEAIRDAILATSGRLNRQTFGPPVPVHLTPFMQGLERPNHSGPLDGEGRRSIYQEVRRNFLPPMFLTFDVPLPSACAAKRNVSNVPAQGLIMMNNPLIAEQANLWAVQVIKTQAPTRQRIEQMFITAMGRPAIAAEVDRIEQYVKKQAVEFGVAEDKIPGSQPIWASLAHSMFMLKEFQYVR